MYIVNDDSITRKMEYSELRGISVIWNAAWPIDVNPITYPDEPHDAEMLIHLN